MITVPAHFNNAQRKATKDAGEICGLKVKAIISEPTAAAIAYAHEVNLPENRNIFIFDLGGGTFDVSIASIKGGKVQIKSTSGDANLGGEDFDNFLLASSIKKFEQESEIDLNAVKNAKAKARAIRKLRNACTATKITLSAALEN